MNEFLKRVPERKRINGVWWCLHAAIVVALLAYAMR